jgi:hypothetical protein
MRLKYHLVKLLDHFHDPTPGRADIVASVHHVAILTTAVQASSE